MGASQSLHQHQDHHHTDSNPVQNTGRINALTGNRLSAEIACDLARQTPVRKLNEPGVRVRLAQVGLYYR